ncbi:unnamed protein product [Rotaria sordida]|uniref:Uncharacterized protein n=1 Tax=Rotaria sordida TaxID=392033 RepID=A0A815QJG9_9BILA|nr:unnamed protein product [Rotaria sordida]
MMNKINDDLRISRESNDYIEIEPEKWTEQIKELRQLIDKTVDIDSTEDDHIKSSIPTCSEHYYHYSSVCDKNSYFTGIHQIRCRIENVTMASVFFSTLISSQAKIPWIMHSSLIYG